MPSAPMSSTSGPAAFLVAGTRSGVGKTTVTLGLMGALRRRGLSVAPFKAGPDFIDPGLHALAAGRPSRNLDTWMLSPQAVADGFSRGCQRGAGGAGEAGTVDVAVVEGVMGLFDGARGADAAGSSADLAKFLNIPVILVVDASGMAASVAAVVHGYATLDPALRVAGVILNRVASGQHLAHLAEALAAHVSVPLLGYLGRAPELAIPERHLGLVTAGELADTGVLERIAERVEKGVDLERLLAVTATSLPTPPASVSTPESLPVATRKKVRLGVARDAAFCFIYPETLEALEQAGAEVMPFSPLVDAALPEVDGLYLPGGYPEVHGAALSANRAMREQVRRAVADGTPVYAECGGLIYLSEGIHLADGTFYPFCGVLPAPCRLQEKRAALGYREVTLLADAPLGAAGDVLRGHEFHYATIDTAALEQAGVSTSFAVARRGGGGGETESRPEGYRTGNLLATWCHLPVTPAMAVRWVEHLRRLAPLSATGLS